MQVEVDNRAINLLCTCGEFIQANLDESLRPLMYRDPSPAVAQLGVYPQEL